MKARVELKKCAKKMFSKNKGLAILGFFVMILISSFSIRYDLFTKLHQVRIFIFEIPLNNFRNGVFIYFLFFLESLFIFQPIKIGIKNFYLNLGTNENTNISYILAPYLKGFRRILCYVVIKGLIDVSIVIIGIILLLDSNIAAIICFAVSIVILKLYMSQADYYFVQNKEMSVIKCIKESFYIVNNNIVDLFVLHLSFILWIILEIVTVGLAGIFVYPYIQLTYVEFFKSINNKKV